MNAYIANYGNSFLLNNGQYSVGSGTQNHFLQSTLFIMPVRMNGQEKK